MFSQHETIDDMKKELLKRFSNDKELNEINLKKNIKKIFYDNLANNENDRKLRNSSFINDNISLKEFGKTPNFFISAEFSLEIVIPNGFSIFLKKCLCLEVSELKRYFFEEYDLPVEEVLILKGENLEKINDGILLEHLYGKKEPDHGRSPGNLWQTKELKLERLTMDFMNKRTYHFMFKKTEKEFQLSPNMKVAAAKKLVWEYGIDLIAIEQIWSYLNINGEEHVISSDSKLLDLDKEIIKIDEENEEEREFFEILKEKIEHYPPCFERDLLEFFNDLNNESGSKITKKQMEAYQDRLTVLKARFFVLPFYLDSPKIFLKI